MLEMGLAKFYKYTEFEVSSFIHSKFIEGGLKFKNSTLDPDHAPFLRYFVTREMGLPKIYPYTKFKFSIFTRSIFMKGGLNSIFGH